MNKCNAVVTLMDADTPLVTSSGTEIAKVLLPAAADVRGSRALNV